MAELAGFSGAQRARLRRAGQVVPDEGSELNVVPFLDIIVNVMVFVLATLAVTFTASISGQPPALRGIARDARVPPTVIVVQDGFAVKTGAGNVATGCVGAGTGLAVPRRGGEYDVAALGECLERLKSEDAELRAATQIRIAANPGVDYGTIIAVADAVRETHGGSLLFPDVTFGVPR